MKVATLIELQKEKAKEIGADYTCSLCGNVVYSGEDHCVSCGAIIAYSSKSLIPDLPIQ